jgi:hypothetical protein
MMSTDSTRYFVSRDDTWIEVDASPGAPPYITVQAASPAVHFVGDPDAPVRLTGAPVDPAADTIHTVFCIDASLREGHPLCAVYVRGRDLDLEDRRPPDAPPSFGDAVETIRSALDEILVPVYIDDAIEEASKALDGVVALHTAQYEEGQDASCTYFRTSLFRDGSLLLEAEEGSL